MQFSGPRSLRAPLAENAQFAHLGASVRFRHRQVARERGRRRKPPGSPVKCGWNGDEMSAEAGAGLGSYGRRSA